MAISKKKTKSKRYDPKTYKVYGKYPTGNWTLMLVAQNDPAVYKFVSQNNVRLSKLPKDKAIKEIKARAFKSWSIDDLKTVSSRNVRASDLRRDLKNFND